MKKRVKVYRATDGQGAYTSNLAKFMQKAQMGGQPTMDQMSYPGDQQGQEDQQMGQDQVINMIAMDITNGRPKEETMAKLTNIVGLDFQTADQFFESVRTQVNAREEEVEEESVEEESTPPDPSGNQETIEKEEEEEGPSNNDIAYQDALNDDSDEAVMEGDVEGMFQMGGDVSQDFGDEYSVTLPDVSAYLPSDMYNFWDPENPAAQVAWSDQMYIDPTQQEVDSSYTEMPEEPMQTAKFGGYKKEKKTYINAILKANRKQMGGDAVSEESSTDATGQNYRTAKLKGFLGTLKNNATESLLREQAAQEFDQMYQMGGPEQDVENPMHHLEALSNATGNIFDESMNQVTMAQNGGWLQRLRERNQQQAPNMGFMQRRGFMNPMMPIESIDVRKSGWLFGKPKEYSVTFGPPTLPGGANGAYPGAFYGYGAGYPMMPGMTTTQKKSVTTKGTIINEAAKTTNQEATKEVAQTTPGSTATQTSAEQPTQKEGTTTTNTGGGGGGATTTTNKTNQTVKPKVVTKTIKRDSWGRPEGSEWFGYDPKQKRYTEGPKFEPLVRTSPNVTPGLSNVQKNIETKVIPKSREEAVATNQQYFENQRANWLQPKGMLVDVNANPMGNRFEDPKQAQQQVAIKQQAAKVKKGDTSNLTDAQIKALRLNYSRPGEAAKLKKTNPALYKTLFGQEEGGVIDFDQLQNMEYLQRFVYGGNEDPSLSYINQADMNYSDSKDSSDPYFQYGGVNQVTGIRNNQGQQMQGYVRPDGSYIKDITVNKVGMFGRPKQYSVTYGQPGDPRTPEIKLNTPGQDKPTETKQETPPQASTTNTDTRTNTEGLDFKTARAIRKGERQSERERARGEKVYGTAEEQGQDYYRANPMEQMQIKPLSGMSVDYKMPTNGGFTEISRTGLSNKFNRNNADVTNFLGYTRADDIAKYANKAGVNPYGSGAGGTNDFWANQRSEYVKKYGEPSNPGDVLDMFLQANPQVAKQAGLEGRWQMGGYIFDGGGFVGANPVVYTDNPALVGQSNVDMMTLNPGIQGAQGQVNWADLNNNRGFELNQPKQYVQDPNQINSDQAKRAYSGDVTVDIKNSLSNDQYQAGLNLANAGIRGITGMKNRIDDARIANDFYDNFTADNLYASDPSRDRGDYAESGLYRPDEQGQTWNSRSKQYGGDISFGEDPDYVEGDEVYMTDDEIRQYMANGGQVEYL